MITSFIHGGHTAAIKICQEPKDLYQRYLNIHQSVDEGLVGMYADAQLENELHHGSDQDAVKITELGDKTCPTNFVTNLTATLAQRSTCPWYLVTNYDINRFPRTLVEVIISVYVISIYSILVAMHLCYLILCFF